MEPLSQNKIYEPGRKRRGFSGEGILEAALWSAQDGWMLGIATHHSLIKDSSQLLIECYMASACLFPQGFNNIKIAIFIFE